MKTLSISLAIALALATQSCSMDKKEPVSISADSLFHAYHTKAGYGTKGKKYNSSLNGKGLTIIKGDNEGIRYSLTLQQFENSYYKTTNAIAPSVQYCWQKKLFFCAGGLIAFNDGYNVAAVPALGAEVGYGRASIGTLITGTEDHKAAALGLFARFRMWQW